MWITSLIVLAVSVFIAPLLLTRRKALQDQYSQNASLYSELMEAFLHSISNNKVDHAMCRMALIDFINENAAEINLYFSMNLVERMSRVLIECDEDGDHKRVRKYIEACIRTMRREGGIQRSFFFNRHVLGVLVNGSTDDKNAD